MSITCQNFENVCGAEIMSCADIGKFTNCQGVFTVQLHGNGHICDAQFFSDDSLLDALLEKLVFHFRRNPTIQILNFAQFRASFFVMNIIHILILVYRTLKINRIFDN